MRESVTELDCKRPINVQIGIYIQLREGGPYLPALVCSAIVGVVFGDVGVDATKSQLFVRGRRDGLDNQLCIGIRWLGLILNKQDTTVLMKTHPQAHIV